MLASPAAQALPAATVPHVAAPALAATIQPVRERLDSHERASRRSDYGRERNNRYSYGYSSRRDRANGSARTRRAFGYR